MNSWNEARVRVQGWRIEHWLNGVKVAEADLATPAGKALIQDSKFKTWPRFASLRRGHIALQDHGNPVSFRSVKIRELK
jgi:cytochrome c